MHLASLESHHPVDLTGPPSLPAADCGRLAASRSDCDWTEVSLFPLPVMAFAADAPHRQSPEDSRHKNLIYRFGVCVFALVACLFTGSRGKVKNALYYEVVKEQ